MAASDFHFYTRMFNDLTTALTSYSSTTASSVIGGITSVAATLLAIYVMLWGWSMMRGVISEPITDGVGRIVRLTVIVAVALNVSRYNTYLATWLWNTPDALAGLVSGGGPGSTATYLDTLMSEIFDFGDAYYQKAFANSSFGIPSLGLLIVGLALWIVGVIATAYGAFLLALAKIGLAVLLGVGPLFVLMTIFEPTKRFFDAWIGQALNYVFMVMLSSAVIAVIMAILKQYLADSSGAALADPTIDLALPAIVFAIIGALVLVQVPSIASALGGGVALGTLGAVNWAYGKSKGGMAAMRPTNLKRSLNKARSDARIVGNAGKALAAPPMAVYRKITGSNRNRVAKV